MVLCIAITSLTLHFYARLIGDLISVTYDWPLELLAVGGMVLFQLSFIYRRSSAEKTRYYYHMLLVSLCGSVLLWLALAAASWLKAGSMVWLCWFLAVVTWMFFNHGKRVRRLGMPSVLSYTWLLYRVLLLFLII